MIYCGLASRSSSDFSKRRQPATTNQNQNSFKHDGMDLSRSISNSFAESNHDKRKSSPSFDGDMLDQYDDKRDDVSLGDASWKNGLNQVASIEEDKFEARQGAITPVDRFCLDSSSDVSNSTMEARNTPTNRNMVRRLSSAPSTQEHIDLDGDKDELGDLKSCATGSSNLLFGGDISMKRDRDSRPGTSATRKFSPTMNFHSLSMREQRDAPPTKRPRSTSTHEDRELHTAFSNESMGSFRKDFNRVGDKPCRTKEEPSDRDSGDRDLAGGNLSWEIKEQDSFEGEFAISSKLTDVISGEVLGNPFNFSEDFPHPPQGHNAIELEKIDLISGMNPSNHIKLSREPEPSPKDTCSLTSATWVSNIASEGRSYSMDSAGHQYSRPAPGLRYHPASNRFGMLPRYNNGPAPASNRFGMPPPYPEKRNRHGYCPPGPNGMGHPIQHLPPSFQPPPAGMAGPPMTRNAPRHVHIMSSPHGQQDGMNGLNASVKMGNNNRGSFSWSKDDDKRLQEVLKKHKNPKDWDAISKDFGAGRT